MRLQLEFEIPGQLKQVVLFNQDKMIIGTLLSNQVVLRVPDVEPIHALIEKVDDDTWNIVDLGSVSGVKVNGQRIDVEHPIKVGDVITIGGIDIKVTEFVPSQDKKENDLNEIIKLDIPQPPKFQTTQAIKDDTASFSVVEDTLPLKVDQENRIKTKQASSVSQTPTAESVESPVVEKTAVNLAEQNSNLTITHKVSAEIVEKRKEPKDILFSPRKSRPRGDVLECVAYWQDTVLEVDMFHPMIKGFEFISIGNTSKAHFIAAGDVDIPYHIFSKITPSGYKLYLLDGMEARIRKGGEVIKIGGKKKVELGKKDIAHVKYGAIRYFLLFINPPHIEIPRTQRHDPVLFGLSIIALFIYLLVVPMLWLSEKVEKRMDKDDIWSLVYLPQQEQPPVKLDTLKPLEPSKKEIKVEEVKKEPEKKLPPPPPPKKVQPAKPTVANKPKKQSKPPTPQIKPKPSLSSLTSAKAAQAPVGNSKFAPGQKGEGMPSTGAKKPDFRKPGPPTKLAGNRSGGAVGSGMNQVGGARKGKGPVSMMGVEGANNNKPSGVNLDKLGLGVGKILSKTGPGAVHTNFRTSAGGAGGGMGSSNKTYGLGGIGTTSSLGLAGAGSTINNFGSGSGGFGSGQGGRGGLGGAGLGRGTGGGGGGRRRAEVAVPAGDPVTGGGLTDQEVLAVIHANLNQIRHCYDQLLQRSPNTSGKLKVKWLINAQGRVYNVSIVDGTISDSLMRACIVGKIRRWVFPKPRGAQTVTVGFPFVFTPL